MLPNKLVKVHYITYFVQNHRTPAPALAYEELVALDYDNVFSMIKARRAGFHGSTDTEETFANFFAKLRADRIIPPL